MIIEELKQIFSKFLAEVNLFLSKNFNEGLPIAEEIMTLILAGITLFLLLICLSGWFWQRSRSQKKKTLDKLSGREKEKRLGQLKKERDKELELRIKEEEKLRAEKKSVQLVKAEQLEKGLQEQIVSMEEGHRSQQVLELDLKKTAETVESAEDADSFLVRLRKGVDKTRTQLLNNLSECYRVV